MPILRTNWKSIGLGISVFAIMTMIGASLISQNKISPGRFDRFGPALSFACGGTLNDIMRVDDRDTPWVADAEAFLATDAQTFDCDSLPSEIEIQAKDHYQVMHQYSMYLVGSAWRIFGVSWSSISPIFALMFGLTGVSSFLIAKRFMGAWFAAAVAFTFMTSASVMSIFLAFRDFSRAPMVLLSVAIIVVLVAVPRSARVILWGSAGAGLVAGIGLGFRADALALIPLFALTSIFLFRGPWKTWSPRRLLPFAVFIVVFVVSSFPVLRAYQDDGFAYGTFQRVEGLVTPYNQKLGLNDSFYDNGAVHNDNFTHIAMYAFEARKNDIDYFPPPELDKIVDNSVLSGISSDYYWDLVRLFPADFLVRGYRSIELTATLPTNGSWKHNPNSWLIIRDTVVDRAIAIIITPLWIVILGLGISIARNRKLGLFLAFVLLYYGLVNTVQFEIRMNFYHELWFWLLAGVVADAGWRLARRIMNEGPRATLEQINEWISSLWNTPSRRNRAMLIVSGSALSLSLIPGVLTAARLYQSAQVEDFVNDAMDAGRPAQLGTPERYNGQINLYPIERSSDIPEEYAPFWGSARYLAVTFEPANCDINQGQVFILHSGEGHVTSGAGNGTVFDRRFPIDFRSVSGDLKAATILFPAYDGKLLNFSGLGMTPDLAACVDTVIEIPADIGPSITPYFILNPDWEHKAAYLTYD